MSLILLKGEAYLLMFIVLLYLSTKPVDKYVDKL